MTEPKYHPDTCPECDRPYKWIQVIESPRAGEEPDYVFVHEAVINGQFTHIPVSCRVHEHEAASEARP